jgi:hypothetical protein
MQIRALQDCFSVRASWFLEADVSDVPRMDYHDFL